MSWVGLLLIALGAYLAYRLVGALLKILMFLLVLVGAYWFAAPWLGLPSVSDLVYVFGPDFGGKRIEEVARPSNLAGEVTGRVVDGVVDGVLDRVPLPVPAQQPAEDVPAPEPLPEPSAGRKDGAADAL
ncbi:MAG: hypothetical protein KIS72_07060 [Luteimonas sp.]|nr:hypothetical protein [Luteimonas sp.]